MNIGKLNQRIELQNLSKIIDSDGYEVKSWIKLKTCWASVKNKSGKKFYSSNNDNTIVTTNFIIRYDKTIEDYDTRELIVLFNNKKYNVKDINDVNMKRSYLSIEAEVVNNGN